LKDMRFAWVKPIPDCGNARGAGGQTQTLSFRGDAQHRTRNLEIPGLRLRHIPE
jgi:hypothetical protein